MKRIFAFGCSYTCYSWPTWANFLDLEFDEVHNWGLSGIGNQAIAERISEANAKFQFTKDDIVIVQWSSHLRNDWWHQESMPERVDGWKTYGSIFNYHNVKLYDKKWVNTFFYEPAYFMHTLNFISMTQGLLKSTGCQWYMTSISDIRNLGSNMRDKEDYGEKTELTKNALKHATGYVGWAILPDLQVYEKPIWEDHKDHWLMPFEEFCQTCLELTYEFVASDGSKFPDLHPSARQHLLWLKSELSEKISLSENFFNSVGLLVDYIDQQHQKYRTNRYAFDFSLANKEKFPPEAAKLTWPGSPQGF
jgi:hypothetical protein